METGCAKCSKSIRTSICKVSVGHFLNHRLTNLELLQTYGANAWKRYNDSLEHVHRQLSLLLEATKKEIEQLNVQRKTEQVSTKKPLHHLHHSRADRCWKHIAKFGSEMETSCAKKLGNRSSLFTIGRKATLKHSPTYIYTILLHLLRCLCLR